MHNAMHSGPFVVFNIFGANSKLSIKTLNLRCNRRATHPERSIEDTLLC